MKAGINTKKPAVRSLLKCGATTTLEINLWHRTGFHQSRFGNGFTGTRAEGFWLTKVGSSPTNNQKEFAASGSPDASFSESLRVPPRAQRTFFHWARPRDEGCPMSRSSQGPASWPGLDPAHSCLHAGPAQFVAGYRDCHRGTEANRSSAMPSMMLLAKSRSSNSPYGRRSYTSGEVNHVGFGSASPVSAKYRAAPTAASRREVSSKVHDPFSSPITTSVLPDSAPGVVRMLQESSFLVPGL